MTDRFRGNWPPVLRGPDTRERVDLDDILARLTNAYLPGAPFYITASGTFEKAGYEFLRAVWLQLVGGGGAGGGAPAITTAPRVSAGAGGASGGYSEKWLLVEDMAESETVTIGAGGTPSAGSAGGDGSATSFGSHATANGGTGGGILAELNTDALLLGTVGPTNGTGSRTLKGSSSDGIIRISGGSRAGHGHGADSKLGVGGGYAISGAGGDGQWGGGGGGTRNGTAVASAKTGGAGGGGLIIVWPFY